MKNLDKFITGERVAQLNTSVISTQTGTILHRKLTSNTSFSIQLEEGESLTFIVDRNGRTISWPSVQWVGGQPPVLDSSGYEVIVFWKMLGKVCGAYNGNLGTL